MLGLQGLALISTTVGRTVEESEHKSLLGEFSNKLIHEIFILIPVAVTNPTVPAAVCVCAGEPVLLSLTDYAPFVSVSVDISRLRIQAPETYLTLLCDLKSLLSCQRSVAGTTSSIVAKMILIEVCSVSSGFKSLTDSTTWQLTWTFIGLITSGVRQGWCGT